MADRFKAWQCIGCGRIDGPQNCVGICEDRKIELVYAFEHDAALAQLDIAQRRAAALEALVRRLAWTRPRADEWEHSYRALQEEARRILALVERASNA